MPAESQVETLSQFGHSVAPKSVGHKPSKKYRDAEEAPLPLSSDPRVVRGSTAALARKVAASKVGSTSYVHSRTSSDDGGYSDQLPRPTYDYRTQGHVGPDLDLSPYLTVKDEHLGVRQKDVESQTNEFKERPPSPEYVPRKTGIDNTTQITQEDTAVLFDFDREVEPILNVIVYKTLEQALFEVESEEELLALDQAAQQFHADKAVELSWRKQREQEVMAEKKEQEALIAQQVELRAQERRVKTVIGAVQAMNQIIPGVFEAAVEAMYASKVWRRPEVASVEDLVLAKTNEQMKLRIKAAAAAQSLIDEIVIAASELYDTAPAWVDKPLSRATEFAILLMSADSGGAAEGDEDAAAAAAPKLKQLGPVKIADRVSITDVFNMMRAEAAEKGLTLELTLATLHAYFCTVVGRPVAVDGALMNFGELVPDTMQLTI